MHCLVDILCIAPKESLPLRPVLHRRIEVVLHITEKLDLHDVNFRDIDA